MPLVPEVQNLLDQLAALPAAPPADQQAPEELRNGWKLLSSFFAVPVEMAEVADRAIPGPAGPVPVRVYTPRPATAGPRPVLVWFHGGGFVIGDLDTADSTARALADGTGAVVVSVDYRLAPEHRFPAAVDDCYAALLWAAANAGQLGGDPTRLAVGGDSAGGNLAAVTALRARDQQGPTLSMQLLVYPCLDAAMGHASISENAEGYLLQADTMRFFWQAYLGPDGDGAHPYVSPVRAGDLAGLPPALVITAEYDPLRDEGEAYGAALAAAGVPATVTRYDGEIHAFFAAPAVFGPPAGDALRQATSALVAAFSS